MTHVTDDERYRWLNDAFCAIAGEIRNQTQPPSADLVLDIYKLGWDPLAECFPPEP